MSNDEMSDDTLKTLGRSPMPAPSRAARERALASAMLAFEAEQKKTLGAPQGNSVAHRLRSIISDLRGNWIMDTRISLGLGTAAVALLLLPLGYQLMTSTAITPPAGVPPVVVADDPVKPADSQPVVEAKGEPEPLVRQEAEAVDADANSGTAAASGGERLGDLVELDEDESVEFAPVEPMVAAEAPAVDVGAAAAPKPLALEAAPIVDKLRTRVIALPEKRVQVRSADPAAMAASESFAFDGADFRMVAPGGVVAADEGRVPSAFEESGDEFTTFAESPLKVVAEEPVSTFSIDVDTASYSYVRRALSSGWVPEPDSIRIEEMINYFDYSYAGPDTAGSPFNTSVQLYPAPWNPKTQLLQIGIKGYEPPVTEDKATNLTFLIDTSGSMNQEDKLPLLKRAFSLLVNQLGANDTVSIVAYAGSAGVVLEPTSATEKAKILGALENLSAGGSTAGAEGIELAYRLAEQGKVEGGINRVILATDGDFNVGIDDPEDLETFIKGKRDAGIFLSVLGFGQGNLGDDTMQALAQNGNGNAAYIDSFKEAQKVLVEQMGGTLETIAKDVKIQIEFNPALVAEYRLIGYETRALAREDFNNDKVDAGEIGAGHTVTALYEIVPVGSGAELVDPLHFQPQGTPTSAVLPSEDIAFLRLRYKAPEGTESQLIETAVGKSLAVADIAQASEDARWAAAVAAFAQKLKGSNYGETISWDDIRTLAQGARGSDALGYRAEFMQLINMASSLKP